MRTSYFQNHLSNEAEECKTILKYKTKTSCMSKNRYKVSNQNKQGMLFWPKLAQKWILSSEFRKSNSGWSWVKLGALFSSTL